MKSRMGRRMDPSLPCRRCDSPHLRAFYITKKGTEVFSGWKCPECGYVLPPMGQ